MVGLSMVSIQNAKFNRGEMNNILRIGRGEKVVEGHSAVLPERLAGELIKAFSEEGNLIYDPFMGSGTTGMVAHKLNRNWIGSEITEEYCKINNFKKYLIHLRMHTVTIWIY